jgi:hypothetical protein
MDAECARTHLEEVERLKLRKFLTLLFDGWEDLMRRSLYGSVAAEVGEFPAVLSLNDLTGQRGSADKFVEVADAALVKMDLADGKNFVALTTDNPTVMQAFRTRFGRKFPWILVR